ncbi:Uncharacterised protein [Mycobacteroides abscessus subsp. abscessus]|nr:Uncharacterised protein [Mycobacteroides abscessus subsp. abscessus]
MAGSAAGRGNHDGVSAATPSMSAPSTARVTAIDSQVAASAASPKTARATTSASSPDTEVTVARAGPSMASWRRASATISALSTAP